MTKGLPGVTRQEVIESLRLDPGSRPATSGSASAKKEAAHLPQVADAKHLVDAHKRGVLLISQYVQRDGVAKLLNLGEPTTPSQKVMILTEIGVGPRPRGNGKHARVHTPGS